MTTHLMIQAPEDQGQASLCRHYWVIETPNGPVSRGVCRYCEAVRDFKNFIDSLPWSEDPSASHRSARYPVATLPDEPEEAEEA